RIDCALPAESIRNRIRAFSPWPGAFLVLQPGPPAHILKVWEAQVESVSGKPGEILSAGHQGLVIGCGTGALRLLTVQPEGGRPMTSQQFLAGHRLEPGRSLG